MAVDTVTVTACITVNETATMTLYSFVAVVTSMMTVTVALCVQATPSADTAMFFFQTNHLHFSAEFLGRVRLVGSIASLAGVGTYNYLLKDVPLTKMFFWTAVLGTGLGLTQLILITGSSAAVVNQGGVLLGEGGGWGVSGRAM